jgi:hypothetical protein
MMAEEKHSLFEEERYLILAQLAVCNLEASVDKQV